MEKTEDRKELEKVFNTEINTIKDSIQIPINTIIITDEQLLALKKYCNPLEAKYYIDVKPSDDIFDINAVIIIHWG